MFHTSCNLNLTTCLWNAHKNKAVIQPVNHDIIVICELIFDGNKLT